MGEMTGEPAWMQRAVERSTHAAKLRAEQRAEQFLDAAQTVIDEKGSTEFTVQEVVDHSRQSLRSFYLHFDGKHELLLALFEDALRRTAEQIRTATLGDADPLGKVKKAIRLLFELSRVTPSARRALFNDFAPGLLFSHPDEVKVAHAPLVAVLGELLSEAESAGALRPGLKPRRLAALIMQTVMFNAQSTGSAGESTTHPLTADEVWAFCASGFLQH